MFFHNNVNSGELGTDYMYFACTEWHIVSQWLYETRKVRNNESAKQSKSETRKVQSNQSTKQRKHETTTVRNSESTKQRMCETTKARCKTTRLRNNDTTKTTKESNNERAM